MRGILAKRLDGLVQFRKSCWLQYYKIDSPEDTLQLSKFQIAVEFFNS